MKRFTFLFAFTIALISIISCNNSDIPVESNWTVESITLENTQITVPEGHTATLAFHKGNKTAGETGCNRFFGNYTTEGRKLEFMQLGSTRMMCPHINFENAYIQALENTSFFNISGNTLSLMDNNENIIAVLKKIESTAIEN